MADLEDLVRRIRALSRPDRLRLAADLIDGGREDIAAKIASEVVEELAVRSLLGKRGGS